jgi:small acid-soluble spore protein I (minor)
MKTWRESNLINLDLRQAIINNVKNNTKEEMKEVINDSIGNDEKTLPGLGVLFELIWKELSAEEQNRLVDALHNKLQGTKQAAT